MQPNQPGQQGYYQPDQNQPVQPVAPPQPAPAVQPLAPVQPIDKAAFQAALEEPVVAPAPVAPVSAPVQQSVAVEQPLVDIQEEPYDEFEGDESEAPVSWTAHEYLHQEKGTMWFAIFATVALLLLGGALFLQQWSFAVLIVVIAVVIVVSSRRPPRELTYSITDEGLVIDDKLHEFAKFKSFGIIRDGEEFSVMLIPTQRFQPGVTVYFPEEAGEDIVDMLGSRLPMKDLKLDAVDRLVRILRL